MMSSRTQLAVFVLALIAVPAPRLRAQAIVAVQENGHTVYVNDVAATTDKSKTRRTYRLIYWSQTEQRWKPVPGANTMRAARSAAVEVQQYLGMSGVSVPKLPASSQAAANGAVRTDSTTAEVDAAIEQAAQRHHVDPSLVRAVVKVESNFNPRAVSPKGAMGLMQLMPGTARELAVSNPFDPQQNVDAGVRHLKGLLESYGGDVPLTLAAYNAGAKAVARNRGVPPYRETRDYVKRITEIYGSGRAKSAPSTPQIKVFRGRDGVLTISNTD